MELCVVHLSRLLANQCSWPGPIRKLGFDDAALHRLMDIAVERADRCAKKIMLADEA